MYTGYALQVGGNSSIRGTKTVTDVPAYWLLPSNFSKIHPEVGYRINYTSSVAQRKTLDQRINMQLGLLS